MLRIRSIGQELINKRWGIFNNMKEGIYCVYELLTEKDAQRIQSYKRTGKFRILKIE